jgi:hypothetical protein
MKTKETLTNDEPFPTITLPEEDIPKPRLRLYITSVVTVFIIILISIDQIFSVWPVGFYWIQFALGILLSCLCIGLILIINEKRRTGEEETWLEKYGDEIGWPIMILAFTIQFLFPQIRPFLLGAILAGSWLILLWHRRKINKMN